MLRTEEKRKPYSITTLNREKNYLPKNTLSNGF